MTKIAYNACHGGFGLSEAGVRRYAELKGLEVFVEGTSVSFLKTYWTVPEDEWSQHVLRDADWVSATPEERKASKNYYREHTIDAKEMSRTDPLLIQVIEELGDAANGDYAELRVTDIPAGQRYRIDEYDGSECVMTVDDYDWSES